MANCSSCGAAAPDGARFCENCGGEISSGCSGCGDPLAPGAAFCGNCGARTGSTAPPGAAPTPAPVVQPPPQAFVPPPVVPTQYQAPPPQPAPLPPQYQQPPVAQQFQQPMAPPAQAPAGYPAQQVNPGLPPQQVNVHVAAPGVMPGMQQAQPGGWRIPVGYVFALLGGLIGIVLGSQLWRGKVAGPQGFKVPRFDESARFHGKIIVAVGCVMSVIWIAFNSAA